MDPKTVKHFPWVKVILVTVKTRRKKQPISFSVEIHTTNHGITTLPYPYIHFHRYGGDIELPSILIVNVLNLI